MGTVNALPVIADEITALLDPVRRVLVDRSPPHELMGLLRLAGWVLPGLGGVDLRSLTDDLSAVVEAVDALPAAVRADSLPEVVTALRAMGEAFAALGDLEPAFEDLLALLGLRVPGSVAAALAEDVGHLLLLAWLARRVPNAYAVMRALRVVSTVDLPALAADDGTVLRAGGPTQRLVLGTLPDLLTDPIGTLRAAYDFDGLGDPLDAQVLTLLLGSRLRGLLAALGGGLTVWPPWAPVDDLPPAEQDAARRTLTVWLPLPGTDGSPLGSELALAMELLSPADTGRLGHRGPGLELRPSGLVEVTATRGAWTLDLTVAATVDTIFVGPAEVASAGGGTLSATAQLTHAPGTVVVFGAEQGTRLELGTPTIGLGVELAGTPDISVDVLVPGVSLIVAPGDGDSFVAGALSSLQLAATFDLGVSWSRRGGLALSGSNAGLAVRIPIERDIGSVATVHWADVTLAIGETTEVAFSVAVTFMLGPFSVRIEGIGLRVILTFPVDGDGNLGPADVTLAFKPPTGLGFTLDLGEIGGGGGIIGYDPLLGRYFGALYLRILTVELGAMVVVDTRLPGDPDGWALFASIFATFPSLPLGFGFFLSGVGGLVCWNRTLDAEALASGLKSGAIDAILFPDDPLNDIALILSQLDAWFPLAEGSAVFGIAVRITWGTPVTIITGQMGVAVVFPDLVIALLGSVSMMLPNEAEPVLELRMDSLGVIDVPGGTTMMVASLYDSALLRTINLSGDMAFYLSIGASPYFLLSIGGYHPDFDPPCGLPAPVLDLARMRADITISEDVFFALETYVAVTANTLQFGSEATLLARAKVLLTTYTARGSVGFDVLLVFSPFSFVAGFHLDVSVSAGEKELLAVNLAAHLEGPEPWYTSGSASFEFFGIHVGFDFEFGGSAVPETPGCQNVRDLVAAALSAPDAWRAAQPAWADTSTVLFAEDDEDGDDALWIRPDAKLDARQNVAPLDRALDHYGVYAIDGPSTLTVTGAGIGEETDDDRVSIVDWFAPAQYDDLTRAEKLAAPSYEEMTTGIRVGSGSLSFDAGEATTVEPDFEIRIIRDDTTTAVRSRPPAGPAAAALALDPDRTRQPRTVASATFAAQTPTWQTADRVTGTPEGTPGSYRDARLALAKALARDPDAPLRIAPVHALGAAP